MSASATSSGLGEMRCPASVRNLASRTCRTCWPICILCDVQMKAETNSELFRQLPSVDELLHAPDFAELLTEHGSTAVTDAIRSVVARLREQISSGLLNRESLQLALGGLKSATEAQLRRIL